MGGSLKMSGIKAGIAQEPVFYDKDGLVYPATVKAQAANVKKAVTETAAEAAAAAKTRKVTK